MPLARLENFLKNLNGNTLYVDPNELDSTDSIENRGNSKLRPFKTIQRALLEAARFSYVQGSNNDLFDQTTILIAPGTHYIDNRPGYYYLNGNTYDSNNTQKTIVEFNILSNFDITDPANELYIYNSVDGGVIIPKGTSLVATDLRKTKIRPLFVPDPAQSTIEKTSIFRLTGSCYFFGFSLYDGDPLGKVYNTYSTTKVTPSYSHHKLTAFEYADGVNEVVKNSSNTGYTDLETYYYKVAKGYGQQSGRSIVDGFSNLQPNVDEYRIVGELGSGPIGITSLTSGDGVTPTSTITVITPVEHNLSPLTPILISGVSGSDSSVYNGNFVVSQVLNTKSFTYVAQATPTQATKTSEASGSTLKVISDTTTSSSPYIFNCSLKSVYGMNGLHADGSKATGFKSMVTAQFTGISLQKDDRAFVIYDENSGSYLDQTSFGTADFLHQNINSVYNPEWASFHIKASNDAFIQCVSIFAIGYANQFFADSGGDQSITNSNSNFGQRALFSEGFKKDAFPKDDYGFITHIIPPKDVTIDDQNINTYTADSATNTKLYLKGYDDPLNPPSMKVRGYSIGGRDSDKIYYTYSGTEYYASITPNYKISINITSIDTSNDYLQLSTISGVSNGLAVKIISNSSYLPDGIEHNKTYFARIVSGTNVRIYENLENCISNSNNYVNIKNTIGLTTNNLYLVSRVSDLSSGDIGSPIQWDSTDRKWYISISGPSANFVSTLSGINPTLYIKRTIDTRSNIDRSYRIRYVVPKESTNAAVPSSGFIIQRSATPINSSYTKWNDINLSSPDNNILSSVRNTNVIIDAWYSAGTATIVTKNPHKLTVGDKISLYNLKSSNEPAPIGIGTGTGFNGSFTVASVVNDITFTYSTGGVNPGTITAGTSSTQNWLSTRDCSQTSSFRVAPYTIYDANRDSTLPYFTCDEVKNHYQLYQIKEIQNYVKDSTDGVYHITLDCYKNTPITSPFNTSEYKFGQNLDNLYPQQDFDNLIVDTDSSRTIASRSTIGTVDINDPYLSSSKEIIIEYLRDFGIGKKITSFSKSGSNVTITTSENHGISGVSEIILTTPPSGFTEGTYFDIPVCGGSGSNATVNVKVNSSGVPSSVEIANPGSGYVVGDSITIKGIPGSTNAVTGTVNTINAATDCIQVLGAVNSGNNGVFTITSVTSNQITYVNASGSTESSSSAVVILSGIEYPASGVYDASSGITTITTDSNYPHSFASGNKVLTDVNNLGICTVTGVTGVSTFTIVGDASSVTKVYSVGLIPTLKDTNNLNENLNVRQFAPHSGYRSSLNGAVSASDLSINLMSVRGLKKGDFIQIENEIMMVLSISGGTIIVKRALFATQATSHANSSVVKAITILPVELRRPSILRASGHTFEYTGFGPGNYSTGMPSNQTKVLSDAEVITSQALANRGGSVVYSGMNSKGEFFIGRKRWNAATGEEVEIAAGVQEATVSDFNELTVNKLIVNKEIEASTATQTVKDLTVIGNSTFESEVVIESTLTVSDDITVGAGSSFIGNGTIPVGGIIMWSGKIANIPTGWNLCDGTNGTPNLVNKFIIAADADGIAGINTATTSVTGSATSTGGNSSVTLTIGQIPAHRHGVPLASEGVGGGNVDTVADVYGFGGGEPGPGSSSTYAENKSYYTGGTGSSISGSTGVTYATGDSNDPNNASAVTLPGTDSVSILPPYYALAYIMRIS